MAQNYLVRTAGFQDIPKLISLLRILFSIEKDFTADEAKQRQGLELMLKDHKRCVMVAEFNHDVVGMCTAQIVISTAEGGYAALVEDMIVDEGYRGQGIGGALLTSIEQWAINHDVKRLQLVADRNNTRALDFYRALEWNTTQLISLHKKMNT